MPTRRTKKATTRAAPARRPRPARAAPRPHQPALAPVRAPVPSRRRRAEKSASQPDARAINTRATSGMSLTQLQNIAKTRGIAFGGLTKGKLIRKINIYI